MVQICGDDSVELSFCSDTEPDKVYHLILNSFGAKYDRVVNIGSVQGTDVNWNCDGIRYETGLKKMGAMLANFTDSADGIMKYKEQVDALTRKVAELNNVYGNMLAAMQTRI